ncbi:hypothetical protein SAMN04515671_0922 [Nakamurella panacisegetis]|uniref:Double zinc ribbon n=1 Tax=Nakamurella panacisegetis TaxID=1090615 RepID=A0A1H0JHW0_9ACTN|nr:zinc ribbon domain-containing protein [Nakamurella panacisegetis]SDO43358.1 hypothetical protein SAMN04515671_0922 [Nakamurella panacisegetis]
MARSRRSDAAARAEADRAYLESVRSGTPAPPAPHGVHPVAPVPTSIEHPDVMPYVPTAAPTPALGVSPILGEAGSTPPPGGSFTAPTVGPPGPAFPSSAFVPTPEPLGPSGTTAGAGGSATRASAPSAGQGLGPGPLRKAGSYVDQNPSGAPTMTMAPTTSGYPSPAAQPPMSPGFDLPLLLGPNGVAPAGDLVTCPECGEMATVDAARRKSEDFCRNCDFPLFWARTTVVLASGEETGASLRRLPGTVGRAATAAVMCPHCGEPNSPTAQTCVRCLLSMYPVEAPPPPPVYIAPEPEPMPVPVGRDFPLWWILLVSACLLIITLIVVWVALN